MRALLTGATGKVGHAVARALVANGHSVRALVLDFRGEAKLLPPGVEPLAGDVTDPLSVERATDGCEVVFNAMGVPGQWLRDASLFEKVNARGTQTVVAGRAGERYILCDGHLSIRDLADLVVTTAGRGRVPPTAPEWLARILATVGEVVAQVTRRSPVTSRGQLHSLLWDPRPRSDKAVRELGWQPVPIGEGLRLTLDAAGLANDSKRDSQTAP